MNEITLPLEVLSMTALTGPETARFDTDVLRIGRDADGCFAVATDTKAMCLARWNPADDDAPVGTEFSISADLFKEAAKILRKKPFRGRTAVVRATAELVVRVKCEKESVELRDLRELGRFPPWRDIFATKRTECWDDLHKRPICPWMLNRVSRCFRSLERREWHVIPKLMKPDSWIIDVTSVETHEKGLRFQAIVMPLVES